MQTDFIGPYIRPDSHSMSFVLIDASQQCDMKNMPEDMHETRAQQSNTSMFTQNKPNIKPVLSYCLYV